MTGRGEDWPGVRLPTPAQAEQMEKASPGILARLMAENEEDGKHRRSMERAESDLRKRGQYCAFGTVIVLALLAAYFAYLGAWTQGASIIVTALVAIVTVFLTSRRGVTGQASPQVSFRVPEQTRRRAEQRASAEGRSVSEVAREALELYLEGTD